MYRLLQLVSPVSVCLLSAALLLHYVGVLGCFVQLGLVSVNAFSFSECLQFQ